MNYQTFQPSKSLQTIPDRKLNDQIQSLVKACKTCSEKSGNSLDGLCQRCSVGIIAFNRYYDAGIPIIFWPLGMDEFKGPPELKKAYDFIAGNISSFYDNGVAMCFAGSHGIGKSLTSCSILKLAAQKNYSACYTTFSDMISALVSSPFDEQYNAKRQLMMSDFLCVDEVDPRHIGKGLSEDLYGRALDSVFRSRMQNKLPTIIISNSPNVLETFNGSIKESLGSLMSKMRMVVCRGEDHRKIKQ